MTRMKSSGDPSIRRESQELFAEKPFAHVGHTKAEVAFRNETTAWTMENQNDSYTENLSSKYNSSKVLARTSFAALQEYFQTHSSPNGSST